MLMEIELKTIILEEMTWVKIQEAIKEGYKTVIFSVASTEQHGPHLPTGTDSYGGDCYARKVAETLGNALVAPTIRFGCSKHHMGFPGTIAISTEVLIGLIQDICFSLDSHGFENIVIISSHGNNHGPVIAAAQEVATKVKATIIALAYPNQATNKMDLVHKKYGITSEEAGYHAGASETAFIMAYKPQLVEKDRLQKGYVGPYAEKFFYTVEGLKRIAPIGVFGDPTKASREMGEEMIKIVTERYVEIIKHELKL
jgi:creatinine amidohydrolase